jgi:hypothetical protein
MQNIQYLKEQNAVLVPIEEWEKLQNELARLKNRVKKAKVLSDFKESLSELKNDLQSESYDSNQELSADEFIAALENEQ